MSTAEDIVRDFWRLMATNDFASVKEVLAEGFITEPLASGTVKNCPRDAAGAHRRAWAWRRWAIGYREERWRIQAER